MSWLNIYISHKPIQQPIHGSFLTSSKTLKTVWCLRHFLGPMNHFFGSLLGFLIRRCISIRLKGIHEEYEGSWIVDVHFPWWYFPIFGSQKNSGTSEFPLTKNHMFLFLCQVSPCLWGPPLRPVHPWAFCNFFQRVFFQRKGTRWRA